MFILHKHIKSERFRSQVRYFDFVSKISITGQIFRFGNIEPSPVPKLDSPSDDKYVSDCGIHHHRVNRSSAYEDGNRGLFVGLDHQDALDYEDIATSAHLSWKEDLAGNNVGAERVRAMTEHIHCYKYSHQDKKSSKALWFPFWLESRAAWSRIPYHTNHIDRQLAVHLLPYWNIEIGFD